MKINFFDTRTRLSLSQSRENIFLFLKIEQEKIKVIFLKIPILSDVRFVCFLLSSCEDVFTDCHDCWTGVPRCNVREGVKKNGKVWSFAIRGVGWGRSPKVMKKHADFLSIFFSEHVESFQAPKTCFTLGLECL